MVHRYKESYTIALMCFFIVFLIIVPYKIIEAEDFNKIKADLDDRDWNIRLAAVEKIGKLKNEETVNLLMQVADEPGEYWPVKIKAIQLLGETANPEAVTLLLLIFNDPFRNDECPSIKSYTAIALGNFRDEPKVVDTLIGGVDDRELLTREASIQSLGKIGSPKAVSYLLQALKEENITIKLSAIKALENIGDPQAIPHLKRIAETDSDPVVKSRAKTVLDNFRHIKEHN
ncbi:MAG: hypothetical protein A2Y97_12295 [Nitrospirae bacterium RBG_13_39_12]|nr:MAG: hypothetical protein A2Y97_12295 [Nitrospirae bacterium RBG_13_39_12]